MAIVNLSSSTELQPLVVDNALQRLERAGAQAAFDVLVELKRHPAPDAKRFDAALDDLVALLLIEFDRDGHSAEAYRILKQFSRELAEVAFHLLMRIQFPDGNPDIAELPDASVLCLVGLMSAAGAHENAQNFLREMIRQRAGLALRHALWIVRCRSVGCAEEIAAFWPPADLASMSTEAHEIAISETPLDVSAHRAIARHHVNAGRFSEGLNAYAVALVLPVESEAKLVIADDLAVLVPILVTREQDDLIGRDRLRWALAAAPDVTRRAAALVRAADICDALPFLGSDNARRAEAFFQNCLRHDSQAGQASGVTAFPMRDGKPHVDIVWLEITNFCNQKCGFCPDPFREAPRSWLPFDEVKRLIDELADTMSVGSMQLNAYGEPLLHPHIAEILAYLREKKLPWRTFFTSHGLTLVDKKLQQLSHNYPAGIAISLHNDNQDSYAATRSAKIGDYDTLVARVRALLRQMVFERAESHLRLYQMVCNGAEAKDVNVNVRNAFPGTPERMLKHVRLWERIAADIAASAPPDAEARSVVNTEAAVEAAFFNASHRDGIYLPILYWKDTQGGLQCAFMSPRPLGNYANLLLEYDPDWTVERKVVNRSACGFTATPSLAIFATGRLGICCLDLNSTATFGKLSDYGSLREALTSREALQMFAELSNGVASSRGCQICMGSGKQLCAPGHAVTV